MALSSTRRQLDTPQVAVLAVAALAEQLDRDLDQALRGVREIEPHDLAGLVEPAVVLDEVQSIELLVVGVPVRAHTLEDAGAVVEGVGQDTDLGVLHWDELAIEEGPRGVRRRAPAQLGLWAGQLLHHRSIHSDTQLFFSQNARTFSVLRLLGPPAYDAAGLTGWWSDRGQAASRNSGRSGMRKRFGHAIALAMTAAFVAAGCGGAARGAATRAAGPACGSGV